MLFERNSDDSHLLRTLQNLAQLSLVKGDKNLATRLLTTIDKKLDTQHNQEKMINSLLFSYLNFANGNLQEATQHAANAKRLAQESEDSRAKTEVLLWEGEICLLTANWSCLKKRIESVSSTISTERHEQYAVYQWLTLGLKHHQGNLNDESDHIYKTLLNNSNVPVITEIKILLDMQQRLSLDATSSTMEKLNSLIKPTYYQQYLQWLYIKASFGNEASVEKLKQKLALYPLYWRNHLFYRAVPGKEETVDKLTTQWLSQLAEKQAGDYRNAYIE